MISARSFVAGLSVMRPPAISLFIAAEILLSSTWAAVAQGTCRAICPNGSMSETYNCNSNYTPLCLRTPSAPGGGYIAPPPQEDTTFSQDLRAYSDLLDRASRELPNFAGIEAISTSPAELSGHLDQLYDRLINVSNYENAQLIDEKNDRRRVQIIPGEIAAIDKEVNEIQHRNGLMHNYVEISSYESSKLVQYAGDQIWRAINWLDYARPSDLPRHWGTVSTTSMDIPHTQEYVEPPVAVFPTSSDLPFIAISDYSNTEKISAIDRYFDHLVSRREEIKDVHNSYDYDWLKGQRDTLYHLGYLRDKAIFDGKELLKQVPVVHTYFVVAAVEALAWKTYADDIAIPEAMKFYDLNKGWYQWGLTDDTVRRGLDAGKMALSVLSTDAKGMKEFLDVQERTLGLLGDAQRIMSEAPNIIVNGTPEQMQALLREIDNRDSDFNLAVVRDAAKSLGPYPSFAQAVINGYVPLPYQGLAEKLGLGD
jgi:hypothetical protein